MKESYGTATGGLCSIFATTIILFFALNELYGLAKKPTYNQNRQVKYLPASN